MKFTAAYIVHEYGNVQSQPSILPSSFLKKMSQI